MCYGYRMTLACPYNSCRETLNELLYVVLCGHVRVIFQCSEARQKMTVDDAYGNCTAQYMSDGKEIYIIHMGPYPRFHQPYTSVAKDPSRC
jgi:hypothetical protein